MVLDGFRMGDKKREEKEVTKYNIISNVLELTVEVQGE
jgi:hypothetical protein